MQVQEVLLVVSIFLLVILLTVTLTHCTLTLLGRRRGSYDDTSNAEAQTDKEES